LTITMTCMSQDVLTATNVVLRPGFLKANAADLKSPPGRTGHQDNLVRSWASAAWPQSQRAGPLLPHDLNPSVLDRFEEAKAGPLTGAAPSDVN